MSKEDWKGTEVKSLVDLGVFWEAGRQLFRTLIPETVLHAIRDIIGSLQKLEYK